MRFIFTVLVWNKAQFTHGYIAYSCNCPLSQAQILHYMCCDVGTWCWSTSVVANCSTISSRKVASRQRKLVGSSARSYQLLTSVTVTRSGMSFVCTAFCWWTCLMHVCDRAESNGYTGFLHVAVLHSAWIWFKSNDLNQWFKSI